MIKSFKSNKTKRVYETAVARGFKGLDAERAVRILDILEAADSVGDLPKLNSYRLHKLSGDRKGQWSITVNLPWTICFTPSKDGFENVEIVNYH